ncbi:MAG: GGDEF domain-containing protein [Rhodobacteraceae bacterium]|nr:GGDEF domain-containing protein [Paracoccaceae bacterium]
MDGQAIQDAALIGADALGKLMPMYLWVTPTGLIRAVGPTLAKLCAPESLIGRRFLDFFQVDRPRALYSMADVQDLQGQRILLSLRDRAETGLRGQAQPLSGGQGWLLNLSFGISVADAVRDHRLTNGDFAPTDLTVELLYLTEVKAAVMGELAALNARLQAAQRESEARALSDALTGLANRRALDGELARACHLAARGEGSFALMHLDLDFFKAVNDTLGHAAGDLVLCEVAQVLREETRKSDTVARVGGDEFVIILRGEADPAHVARIGTRIISELERPILYEGEPCRISGSIGVTLSGFYEVPDPEQMHADADEATYAAKRAGRGRCVVSGG